MRTGPRGPSWIHYLRFVRAFRVERGLVLVALAPALLALDRLVLPARPDEWGFPAQVGAAAALALSGLLLPWRPGLARALGVAAAVVGVAPLATLALEHPQVVVLAAVALWLVLHAIVSEPNVVTAALEPAPDAARTARTASLVALTVWFVEVVARVRLDAIDALVTAVPSIVAAVLAVRWARRERARPHVAWALGGASALSLAGAAASYAAAELALSWLALVPLFTLILARASGERGPLGRAVERPAPLLIATFLGLCAVGTALLAIPAVSAGREALPLADAAFTAVSAVCVTGLGVIDPATALSPLGQLALLVLVQVGGLGIMSFYTVAFAALGRRLSLRYERAVAGAMNVEDRRLLVASLRRVLAVTLAAEAAGALVLFVALLPHAKDAATAAWHAVFMAVSAFCNAGFTLGPGAIAQHQTSPIVLYTVAALVVLGSLSPASVVAIPAWARRRPVGLEDRLALVTTLALVVFGAIAYALFEWSTSLGHLSWIDRVHNAIFQSVALRTAGFSSLDLGATRPATRTLVMGLMLIGGSPGGTAGGLKTTTIAVVVLMLAATLRGQPRARAYGREIAPWTVFKAGAVITAGVGLVFAALTALQLTQDIELGAAAFEVVSAVATTGGSLGATVQLDPVGRVLVMLCMFVGRVGPLTLFVFLTEQQHETAMHYPEQEVDVG